MNTFSDRLNKTITEIKNMKMNQVIGGDSWVVYRTEATILTTWNSEYLIQFSPEVSNDYVAVCKVTSPDRGIFGSIRELIPDANIQGKWWLPSSSATQTGNPVEKTFFVYSTVKGTVSVQNVTGRDMGTIA